MFQFSKAIAREILLGNSEFLYSLDSRVILTKSYSYLWICYLKIFPGILSYINQLPIIFLCNQFFANALSHQVDLTERFYFG